MICASLVLLQIMFAVHRFAQGAEGKVLKIDRHLAAGGFLSLTAFQAEGCGIALRAMSFIVSHLSSIPEHAPPLNITMSADAPIVISTEAKRSGEISLHHGS